MEFILALPFGLVVFDLSEVVRDVLLCFGRWSAERTSAPLERC